MRKYKEGFASNLFDVLNHTFMALLMITMLYPFLYIIFISISDYEAIAINKVKFYPIGIHFNTYRLLLKAQDIPLAFKNSVIYTVMATVFALFIASMTAFVLEQTELPYRKPLIIFFILTMFIPGGMIPNFLLIKSIGFYNTLWALTVPPAFGCWNILIIRSNIRSTVSRELIDAAHIDGANDFRIYLTIVLPLIKPILATIALFVAVSQWNNFFGPLIYLNDARKYPLPLILRKILLSNQVEKYYYDAIREAGNVPGSIDADSRIGIGFFKAIQMAAIVVAVFPIIAIYPFLQQYFVKGIMLGSLKG